MDARRGEGTLVVAATAQELEGIDYPTLCCGIGPVAAAVSTARTLAESRPAVVVHVGIAGARSLEVPSLVIGSRSVYCDLQGEPALGLSRLAHCTPDAGLLVQAIHRLPQARVAVIGTSGRIGGAADCEVEAMEGFAVLSAAAAAGIAAIELRAISNRYGAARAEWRVDEAIALLPGAVEALLGDGDG